MKNVGLMGLVVILVGVFGGYWVYTATMPDVAEDSLMVEPSESFDSSQFLQLKPDSVPPVAETEDEREEMEIVNDKNEEQGSNNLGRENSKVGGMTTEESGGGNVAEIDEQSVIVSMTDLGFVPTSVTVSAGTVVTFVNDGQSLHWPASDFHPMHEMLPEFDAGKGVTTGGVYSYRFVKEGKWLFHDHLNPDFGGTVVVEKK